MSYALIFLSWIIVVIGVCAFFKGSKLGDDDE
jgi:hypothetical protein